MREYGGGGARHKYVCIIRCDLPHYPTRSDSCFITMSALPCAFLLSLRSSTVFTFNSMLISLPTPPSIVQYSSSIIVCLGYRSSFGILFRSSDFNDHSSPDGVHGGSLFDFGLNLFEEWLIMGNQ